MGYAARMTYSESPVTPTFGERRRAEAVASCIEVMLHDKGSIFYADLDGHSHFASFSAHIEKPRSINNLAGGIPQQYRLIFESTYKPGVLSSHHPVPLQAFADWVQKATDTLASLDRDIEVARFDVNTSLSKATFDLNISNPATIKALDGIIAQQQNTRSR